MSRLFFALWPDAETMPALTAVTQALGQKGIQAVIPENLHVTLAFLGTVNSEQATFLQEQAKGIQCQSFDLCFDRLEYWRRPKVLCLSARETPQALADLARDLTKIGLECGLTMDSRPYLPHVTLAKKVGKAVELEFAPIHWQANTFVLAESVSQPGGVRYKPVDRWPFICARTPARTE